MWLSLLLKMSLQTRVTYCVWTSIWKSQSLYQGDAQLKSIDRRIDVARIFVIRHFIYCNVNYLILMLFSLFVVIAVIMRFHQIYIFTVNLFLLRRVLRRVTKSVVEDLSFSFFNSIIPSTVISIISTVSVLNFYA